MNSVTKIIKRKSWLVVFTGILLAGLCGSVCVQAQDSTAGKTVTQKKFQRLINKKNAVLLDVRTAEEYKSGHIPGARQIDVQKTDDFKRQIESLDKNKIYLLYCRSGKRSNAAKMLMNTMGFTKLYDLEGGFAKWTGSKEQ